MSLLVVCDYPCDATQAEICDAVTDIIIKPAVRIGYECYGFTIKGENGENNDNRYTRVTIEFTDSPPSQEHIAFEPIQIPDCKHLTPGAYALLLLLQFRYETAWTHAGTQNLVARKLLRRCQVDQACLLEPIEACEDNTDNVHRGAGKVISQWDFGKGTLTLSSGRLVHTSILLRELLNVSLGEVPIDVTKRAGGGNFRVLNYDSEIRLLEHCIDVFIQAKRRLHEKDLLTREPKSSASLNRLSHKDKRPKRQTKKI